MHQSYFTVDSQHHLKYQVIAQTTGSSKRSLPIKYLGCMLFIGREKKRYFEDLNLKLRKKVAGWKGQLLSSCSRLTFIKYVLQSIPLHILSATDPPKSELKGQNNCLLTSFGEKKKVVLNTTQ